nr:MarR family winged helix-turn-helix transcriptional regulator [Gaiellaceae bacterium]
MALPDADELESAAAFRSELRRFLRRSEALAAEAGLTPQRYDLLLQLKAAPAGHSTVTELGERLHLRQTAVTELVKRAEDAGLVRRRRSESDRRVFLLELTADGDRRVTEVFEALRRDRAAFAQAFDELGAHFRAATVAG